MHFLVRRNLVWRQSLKVINDRSLLSDANRLCSFSVVRVIVSSGVFVFLVLLHVLLNHFLYMHVLRPLVANCREVNRSMEPALDLSGINGHITDW